MTHLGLEVHDVLHFTCTRIKDTVSGVICFAAIPHLYHWPNVMHIAKRKTSICFCNALPTFVIPSAVFKSRIRKHHTVQNISFVRLTQVRSASGRELSCIV